MAKKMQDPSVTIVDAALALTIRQGWNATSLTEIAAEAGITLAELHTSFASKTAILDAFHRRIDGTVLEGGAADLSEKPRDRLFDVVMRRFDALRPWKDAIGVMWRETGRDPGATLCAAPLMMRSMTWMIEAAGLSTSGWKGIVRVNLLTGIYLSLLPVWLADDSADMTKTMAALDRRLRRTERWFGHGARGSQEAEAKG